ncbi:MAG: phosphopantetheine-binding protein [Acidimicrobiales bacterium]
MGTAAGDAGLADELIALINDEITLDPSVPVEGSTDLLLTGLVDSLGVVQIVEWLEDRTGVEIDPGDVILEHFQTVDLMVAFMDRLATAR